jgi:hypothetical protein
MKPVRHLAVALGAALVGALLLAGCQNGVSGPSLTAATSAVTLMPSLGSVPDLEANKNTCCCHVTGTVKNTSGIEVHVELKFPATNRQTGQPAGTALTILRNIGPGASRDFSAIGIYAPCNALDRDQVVRDQIVNIKGLWEPD